MEIRHALSLSLLRGNHYKSSSHNQSWASSLTNGAGWASRGGLSSRLNEWGLTQQTLFFATHPRNYHLGVHAPVRTVKVEFNGLCHCNLTHCTCWSSNLNPPPSWFVPNRPADFWDSVLQNLIIQPVVMVDATECLWKSFWRFVSSSEEAGGQRGTLSVTTKSQRNKD